MAKSATYSESLGDAYQGISNFTVPRSPSTFSNMLFRGPDHILYNRTLLKKFSPEAREKFLAIYQSSLGLKELPKAEGHIQTYLSQRQKTLEAIGLPVVNSPEVDQLAASYKDLDTIFTQIGARYHPSSVQAYLQDERSKTFQTLKKQFEQDQQAIRASTLTDKEQKLKYLAEEYDKQVKALETSLNEQITQAHQAVSKEQWRVYVLAQMRQENQAMREAIDTVQARNMPVLSGASIEAGGDEGLSNVTIDELIKYCDETGQPLRTPIGTRINVSKTDDGYSFQLAPVKNKWFFNQSKLHPSKADWLFMGQLLRATGKESVTITINTKNDKNDQLAMREARIAYEAQLEAGFAKHVKDKDGKDKPNITIIVNGKKIEYDKLYVQKHTTYHGGHKQDSERAVSNQGESVAQERAKRLNKSQDIKKEVEALRKDMEAKRPPVAKTPTTPSSRASAGSS